MRPSVLELSMMAIAVGFWLWLLDVMPVTN